MANNGIKISEVSDILRMQLEGLDTDIKYDETGQVISVSDGVVRIYGLRNAESNELLLFDNGMQAIVMNLEEDNVGAILLGATSEVKEGYIVKRTGHVASIRVGEGMLGRVISPTGKLIDGKGAVKGELLEMPLERKAPGVIFRQPGKQATANWYQGSRCDDPHRAGPAELIIGDRQTGKSSIAIDTILNQRKNYEEGDPVYCIYVAIGQKGSTVASLVKTLTDHGAMDYTIVIAASGSDTAALRYIAPFAGAAVGDAISGIQAAMPWLSSMISPNRR